MLEERLITLKRGTVETERKVTARTRKELLLEIEQERNRARDAASRQRKELELEAGEEPLEP